MSSKYKNTPRQKAVNNAMATQTEAKFQQALQLHQQGQLAQANALYEEILKLQPRHFDSLHLSGVIAYQTNNPGKAVTLIKAALEIQPNNASVYYNLGLAFHELRQLKDAVASYDRAIALKPDYSSAYWNKSLSLLLDGNFKNGWEVYEWRWKKEIPTSPKRNFLQPLWSGTESLSGKTILLHSEQGLGDSIQFCRYAKCVADVCDRVILEVEPPLISLLQELGGIADIIAKGSELPPFDYHCPLLSLPLAFKTNLDSIPFSEKYLLSNTSKHAYWNNKLGEKTKLRIGIVWSGNAQHRNNHNRSILLKDLIKILPSHCQYVSLQKEVRDTDQSTLESNTSILHFGDELHDFADTAALCELMDIVISVDTSVAHLSGAIGKTTWVLLPFCPDWRWLLNRDDSPWYKSVQLYRQPKIGDWESVLAAVSRDLETIEPCDPTSSIALQKVTHNALTAQTKAIFQQALQLHQQGQLAQANALYEEILKSQPGHFDALHLSGIIAYQTKNFQQGIALIGKAIAISPNNAALYNNQSIALGELCQFDDAVANCDRAIALKPDYAEAYYNRGFSLQELKRLNDAVASYDKAIALKPDYAEAYYGRGNALRKQQQYKMALASYDQAITLKSDYAEAYCNRGIALQELRQLKDAVASYKQAIALKPNFAEVYSNIGNAMQELKQLDNAVANYNQAIALKPDYAEAYCNRGIALKELRQLDDAVSSYDRAIALKPDCAEAYYNRGITLKELRKLDDAVTSYGRAIALKPDYAEAYSNRGIVLMELKQFDDAIASYDQAIALKPDYAEAYCNRGNALIELKQLDDALSSYDLAIALKPDGLFWLGKRLHTKMHICEWTAFDLHINQLSEKIEHCKKVSSPFPILAIADSLSLQKEVAKIYVQEKYPATHALPEIPKRARHDKIRIGYYSADFHNHATAYLMAGLFETHDRSQFELFAFSFGPEKNDGMRTRVTSAFDRFIDMRTQSDKEIALLSRELEIDIAIDLKGFTQDSRVGIFALRAAPIQVNYLGYPGTMGADYIDYLIADRTLIPESSRHGYSEKIVTLPDCYQVNDARRPIADKIFTRKEVGLPETGFVFCCFNNNYKITPTTFEGWMRILKQVEGSVLWLLEDNLKAASNLRQEATKRGVDAERLIFAQRMPLPEHLARHRLADLFLDTLPCNAHTTASDALWAGLPVLTCMGESFASRVAASLLNAIHLPELVTSTQDEYEALAIELATHPEKLNPIRQKLAQNRLTTPLFDTQLFTRHIEEAYRMMYERYQDGLPPNHLFIKPSTLPAMKYP